MNYKKKIIILVCTLFIYMFNIFVYNKISSNNYSNVFILKKDVLRGDILKESDLEKITIKNSDILDNTSFFISNEYNKFVAKKDLSKGNILLNENLIEKSKYNNVDENLELISIKIKNPEDIVSYQIEKNSIVNLYYTSNLEMSKDLLDKTNFQYFNIQTDNKSNFEYITIKLAENIKVINLFDKYGNIIENKNYIKNETNKIDTIMFEMKNDIVMKINNLKKYGEFSVSIKR